MKRLQYLWALLSLAVVMAACGNGSFKIDGTLANLSGSSVRVTLVADSTVVDQWVDVDKKGKFSFEGFSAQPVLVSLLDRNGKPLVMLVAANGDHLKVNGDAAQAASIRVKGNRLNEDWQLFRDEHKAFYTDPNPSRLDAAIEKFVREHPGEMLSTVLLLADYSDYGNREKVISMLNGIDAKARPKSLAWALEGLKRDVRLAGHLPRLMTVSLVAHGGDIEEIKLTGRMTLMHMWANPQDNRAALIGKVQGAGEGFHVIDILAEGDTMHWQQTIATDPSAWKHYWAPGGPLEQDIQLLGFTSVPWFAVIDSTGLVTYSGPSVDDAIKAVAAPATR